MHNRIECSSITRKVVQELASKFGHMHSQERFLVRAAFYFSACYIC